MTMTRAERVLRALNQLCPSDATWEVRNDEPFRTAFPCGIAPLFRYRGHLLICIEQIIAGAGDVDAKTFEGHLDALITFVFATSAGLIMDESAEHVINMHRDMYPVDHIVLRAAATKAGLSLADFMGLNRPDAL
jgi:hypothetical protein